MRLFFWVDLTQEPSKSVDKHGSYDGFSISMTWEWKLFQKTFTKKSSCVPYSLAAVMANWLTFQPRCWRPSPSSSPPSFQSPHPPFRCPVASLWSLFLLLNIHATHAEHPTLHRISDTQGVKTFVQDRTGTRAHLSFLFFLVRLHAGTFQCYVNAVLLSVSQWNT